MRTSQEAGGVGVAARMDALGRLATTAGGRQPRGRPCWGGRCCHAPAPCLSPCPSSIHTGTGPPAPHQQHIVNHRQLQLPRIHLVLVGQRGGIPAGGRGRAGRAARRRRRPAGAVQAGRCAPGRPPLPDARQVRCAAAPHPSPRQQRARVCRRPAPEHAVEAQQACPAVVVGAEDAAVEHHHPARVWGHQALGLAARRREALQRGADGGGLHGADGAAPGGRQVQQRQLQGARLAELDGLRRGAAGGGAWRRGSAGEAARRGRRGVGGEGQRGSQPWPPVQGTPQSVAAWLLVALLCPAGRGRNALAAAALGGATCRARTCSLAPLLPNPSTTMCVSGLYVYHCTPCTAGACPGAGQVCGGCTGAAAASSWPGGRQRGWDRLPPPPLLQPRHMHLPEHPVLVLPPRHPRHTLSQAHATLPAAAQWHPCAGPGARGAPSGFLTRQP